MKQTSFVRLRRGVLLALLLGVPSAMPRQVGAQVRAPVRWAPPAPPHAEAPAARPAEPNRPGGLPATPTVEWRYHKTTDGAHPDGREQQLLWLTNRARANPRQTGVWLATTALPDIAFPRDYFAVDLGQLQREFAGYAARPPAAFDARLYAAALAHCRDLIARDAEDHVGQLERLRAVSFRWRAFRGNVLSYATDPVNAFAAFAIDWGPKALPDYDGMQTGRHHRSAVLSLDGDYTNVGIAIVDRSDPKAKVGPLVLTEDFCNADTSVPDHFNRFIVGTVWTDLNGDGLYQPGEGIEGAKVTPATGRYYAVTGNGGGYAIPILSVGIYQVTFSGPASGERSVTVGNESVPLDFEVARPSGQEGEVAPEKERKRPPD